jgi:hypothetical protein
MPVLSLLPVTEVNIFTKYHNRNKWLKAGDFSRYLGRHIKFHRKRRYPLASMSFGWKSAIKTIPDYLWQSESTLPMNVDWKFCQG